MKVLLDTNVLLKLLLLEEDGLPIDMEGVLAESGADLLVSAAACWEIAIKARIGKLNLPVALAELPDAMAAMRIMVRPISLDHVLAEVEPWPDTSDPFDRLMLAVAKVERAPLLTLDRKLAGHPLAWRP